MTDDDGRPGYVAPDEFVRHREYYDHLATENRRRLIDNAVAQRL